MEIVSILPRLATGIHISRRYASIVKFLFFPVLRRGSAAGLHVSRGDRFYSSPSCDGDPLCLNNRCRCGVSILPRLATGIGSITDLTPDMIVSILPRLATGIHVITSHQFFISFYSSPSCDGDPHTRLTSNWNNVSILPRLATGITTEIFNSVIIKFLFFPVLRRGSFVSARSRQT